VFLPENVAESEIVCLHTTTSLGQAVAVVCKTNDASVFPLGTAIAACNSIAWEFLDRVLKLRQIQSLTYLRI